MLWRSRGECVNNEEKEASILHDPKPLGEPMTARDLALHGGHVSMSSYSLFDAQSANYERDIFTDIFSVERTSVMTSRNESYRVSREISLVLCDECLSNEQMAAHSGYESLPRAYLGQNIFYFLQQGYLLDIFPIILSPSILPRYLFYHFIPVNDTLQTKSMPICYRKSLPCRSS